MYKISILLLFNLTYFLLSAQKYAPIQIEFGTGIISTFDKDLAAVIPFSIEIKTQKGLWGFSLRYQNGVKGLGVDHPESKVFIEKKILFSTFSSPESDYLNRLKHWESYQIWGDLHIKIGYFSPIIGLAFSFNRVNGFKKKEILFNPLNDINTYIVAPIYYPAVHLRLGYKVKKFRFYVESQIFKDSRIPTLLYLGTAINIGLSSRLKKEVNLYENYKEEKKFLPLIFRIELTGGYIFLFHKERNAGSFSGGVDGQFKIMGNHFLGIAANIGSLSSGYDRETQEVKRDFIITNASREIQAYTLYYRYNRQFSLVKAFYYGAGIGNYVLPTTLKSIPANLNRFGRKIRFETESFRGINGHVGFRSSLIAHTLEVHFPFADKRTFVVYKMGIGLSFHK